MSLVTIKEAQTKGLKFYFTGKPCKNGHVDKRYVKSSICFSCSVIKDSPRINAIKARKEAEEKGQRYYNTGKACKIGHESDRLTSNGSCLECSKLKNKERHEQGLRKEYFQNWYIENKERILDQKKDYYIENKEHIKERNKVYIKSWREENKEHEKIYNSKYKKENKEKVRANNSKRRANKIKALPSWADLDSIKQIYLNCPKEHHVDHIIPLKNDLVCGLHVPDNLQYLTATENLNKHNKFEPYIEERN